MPVIIISCVSLQPSPVVPMSSETWSFSFAKYLELRFRGHIYTRRDTETCKHSLHHDHYQYFGMNKVVALFKFSPVAVWEISLPPPIISIQFDPQHKNAIMDELRNLAIKGHDIYSSVVERLLNLECSEEGKFCLISFYLYFLFFILYYICIKILFKIL